METIIASVSDLLKPGGYVVFRKAFPANPATEIFSKYLQVDKRLSSQILENEKCIVPVASEFIIAQKKK